MTDLTIQGELAERLVNLAAHEHRSVEAILVSLLNGYQPQTKVAVEMQPSGMPSLIDFPVDDLGPWPAGLTLRREELYGDDER